MIPILNTEDVRADFITMAEALQKCGYQCGHVGKWHLGDDKEGTGPLSQGFVFNIAGERAGTPYSYFYPYCNLVFIIIHYINRKCVLYCERRN